MIDSREFDESTIPTVADSDGDGLTDGDEVNTYETAPLMSDSDGDSVNDGIEVQFAGMGFDPKTDSSSELSTFQEAAGQMPVLPLALQAKMTEVMMPEILKACQDFKAKIVKFIQEREENPTD